MLGGPREEEGCCDGEGGLIGGVPKRGGLFPIESFSAEDNADSDGPGSDDCSSGRPAIGVPGAEESLIWLGVGIWRTAGVAPGMEGTGEPSLAVESTREMDCESAGELRPDARRDEDPGTAFGLEGAEDWRSAMLAGEL